FTQFGDVDILLALILLLEEGLLDLVLHFVEARRARLATSLDADDMEAMRPLEQRAVLVQRQLRERVVHTGHDRGARARVPLSALFGRGAFALRLREGREIFPSAQPA